MDLNQAQVGYFIDQLISGSKYYGFSDADAATLSTFMNARYNIRCAPPMNGQLYSICLAKDCPLAAPESNCEVYNNIQPYGVNKSAPGTETPVLPTTPVSSAPSGTTTAAASSTSPATTSTAAASGSSSSLSGGAIAGIAIGSAAAVLLAAGAWLLFRRKRRAKAETGPAPSMVSDGTAAPVFAYQPGYGSNMHDGYSVQSPYDAYMTPTPDQSRTASMPPQELDAEDTWARGPVPYAKYTP
jgi:hypothetical protein